MNKKYPFIGLTICLEPAFWVYNNYAYVYQCYLESYKLNDRWEFMGDYHKKPLLDSSLAIEKFGNLSYIQNDNFIWVDEVYYEEGLPIETWNYSEYAINCFSAHYELNESEAKGFINDEIYNIEVRNFESTGLCPDSQELDLLVKEYLENIITKWTNKNIFDMGGMSGVDVSSNRLYAFFDYHFEEYQGDMHDFVNHSIELVKGLWNVESVKNTNRQKCFDFWVEDKIVKNNLDRSKLKLEPEITPEPPQQENTPVRNTTKYPASYTQIAPSTEIRPLWVYNNLIHIKGVAGESFELKKYKNHKEEILYVRGDVYRNRLDDFFGYIKQNISLLSIGYDLPEEEVPYYWNFNDEVFTILYFDVSGYSDSETKLYKFDSSKQRGAELDLKFGEKEVLYPDLTKVVRHKLKMIESSDLDSFLNFHFNNCYDAYKFLVHVIEITDDVWENAPNDISCKKVLKKWVKGKIDFLEISNPQVLIDIHISQQKIEYDEKFIAQDFQGNVLLNEYGNSYSNAVPFEVFYNAKLEVKIYEFFQLNDKHTPEPPQAQNNLEEIKNKIKVLCDPATFGHIILELYEKQYIELPQTQGDINYSKTAIQLLQLFDIHTSKDYLAKCVNPNSNSLSEFTKRQIEIPLYDKKKPS